MITITVTFVALSQVEFSQETCEKSIWYSARSSELRKVNYRYFFLQMKGNKKGSFKQSVTLFKPAGCSLATSDFIGTPAFEEQCRAKAVIGWIISITDWKLSNTYLFRNSWRFVAAGLCWLFPEICITWSLSHKLM